ncbi:hypothetical protein [Streptomyces sp. NPDC001492]
MNQTLDVPDFLDGIVTPGSPTAYTEDDRRELRELAIHLLVDNQKLQQAGASHRMHFLLHVLPALDHAAKAGWDRSEIHAAADREYGQWLVDEADAGTEQAAA